MSLSAKQISLKTQIEQLNQEGLRFGPNGLPLPEAQAFDNTIPLVLTPEQQRRQALFKKIEADRFEKRGFK